MVLNPGPKSAAFEPRLLSVDPSLTCSGWALFALESELLLGVGKVRSLPASSPMARRLEDLQGKISLLLEQLELTDNDVLVCEAQTTMRDPRAAFKVEQVRGMFETLARNRGAAVPGRLNPRSVQFEVIGLHGKQLSREVVKLSAAATVAKLYLDRLTQLGLVQKANELCRHQDIVDAVLVGHLGISRLRSARLSSTPIEELFAERKAKSRRIRAA
ncbi:MAG: hypothetical protein K1X83_13845 [Oligoflexia bacterium]|nr:hypothetical protein [Oligoflexia bacterium]